MELRGDDLQTNLEVHYGLIQWFLGRGVMAEPTTRFMSAYLGAVGALQQMRRQPGPGRSPSAQAVRGAADANARAALEAKETLLVRPLARLFANAHLLAGFLGRYDGELWTCDGDAGPLRRQPGALPGAPVPLPRSGAARRQAAGRADLGARRGDPRRGARVLRDGRGAHRRERLRRRSRSSSPASRTPPSPAATTRSGRAASPRTRASSSASSCC